MKAPRVDILPVQMGCCHEEPRCVRCPPPPPLLSPTAMRRLLSRRQPRGNNHPSTHLRVGFFGGRPPTPTMLRALDGTPFSVRVRADLLSRREAHRLKDAGAVAIEVDIGSMQDGVLRASGRNYRSSWLRSQLRGLRSLKLDIGAVLDVGLPSSTHDLCVDDANQIAPLVDFVRIHPVMVVRGSRLQRMHRQGWYEALTVEQAVATCRAMADIFESKGVAIRRIGQNPEAELLGGAIAGPRHSAIRQLVEGKRRLADLNDGLRALDPQGRPLVIRCHPSEETVTRGPRNRHIQILRADFQLQELRVVADPGVALGDFELEEAS